MGEHGPCISSGRFLIKFKSIITGHYSGTSSSGTNTSTPCLTGLTPVESYSLSLYRV